MLFIGKKDQEPIQSNVRWGSHDECHAADVKCLVEYLESKGLDCHINTGVHGTYVNGKFKFAWDNNCGYYLGEDVKSAIKANNKVSLHIVSKTRPCCYHGGV